MEPDEAGSTGSNSSSSADHHDESDTLTSDSLFRTTDQSSPTKSLSSSPILSPPSPPASDFSGFSFSELDLIPSGPTWLEDEFANSFTREVVPSVPEEARYEVYSTVGSISIERRKPTLPVEPVATTTRRQSRKSYLAIPDPKQKQLEDQPDRGVGLFRSLTSSSRRSKSGTQTPRRPEEEEKARTKQTPPAQQQQQNGHTTPPAKTPERQPHGRTMSFKRRTMSMKGRGDTSAVELKDTENASVASRKDLARKARDSLLGMVSFPETQTRSAVQDVITNKRTDQQTPQTREPLFKSFSYSNIPIPSRVNKPFANIPALPERTQSDYIHPTTVRSKDGLWTALKILDSDHQKIEQKPILMKMAAVRASLLPFLESYATHPSNYNLSAEDLERRTTIFDKWWGELLSMLQNAKAQSLPPLDRPVVFETLIAIMKRPEWRHPELPFSPGYHKKSSSISRPDSRGSAASDGSAFVRESIFHNVRNQFQGNLLKQMRFVVQKMSLRNTSVKLVAFSGITCAYAYFFCPGIAERLTRLWKLKAEPMKRVLDAWKSDASLDFEHSATSTVADVFPQWLQPLAFKSFRASLNWLRQTRTWSPEIDSISWEGSWVHRWQGRDGDLFYLFLKHYHILMLDFLPPLCSRSELLRVPSLLYVYTQVLTNIDNMLNRQSVKSITAPVIVSSSTTFEDLLALDMPGISTSLPVPGDLFIGPDNRIVASTRTLLSHEVIGDQKGCARLYCDLFRAATARVSAYSHSACFLLCDFLQEVIPLMARYEAEHVDDVELLDWKFWLKVFARMISSENTVSEIRVYGLVFSVWKSLAANWERKRDICYDLLLQEDHFVLHFNHWCPLVRAFYMRLLCWRVARVDGEAMEEDVTMLETLKSRLQLIWSYHLHEVERAQAEDLIPPSTAPCTPAPGRRLLIIRTDNPALATHGRSPQLEAPPSPSLQAAAAVNGTSLDMSADSSETILGKFTSVLDRSRDANRRKSGLLRNLMGYRNGSTANDMAADALQIQAVGSPEVSPQKLTPQASTDDLKSEEGEITVSSSRASLYEQRPHFLQSPPLSPGIQRSDSKSPISRARSNETAHVAGTFKFSMEMGEKITGNFSQDIQLYPPRLPMASQLLLRVRRGVSKEVPPRKPPAVSARNAKYAGRALAEWSLVVNECQNFFERRRSEGVPNNSLVETPTMEIDPFRRNE